ncbi:PAAR domain-containing protein [Rahnella sp. Larv3_ips]|uniref:PAAR domain-containing protein n=1 Tax=Rahnella sp. Larv3_ips TaxID=1896943 RepID=UPI000EFD9484|nr:PAAR domain-containing protein [Rahnella sp. Larv3_ips]
MAIGYFIRFGDKTSCGGRVLGASSNITHHGLNVARMYDPVSCGKNPGIFRISGGIQNYTAYGTPCAGTLNSISTCPCRAKIFASEFSSVYEFIEKPPLQHAQSVKSPNHLSNYTTGEQSDSVYISDYPATLINTHPIPDQHLRQMLIAKASTCMLITLTESVDVLSSWGAIKSGWVSITQSEVGKVTVNYGLNAKDFITTGLLINKLGGFGIKATVFVNEKGTELIKIYGYPGVRKILNAPVFALKNPKVISLGIGKYGISNVIKEGGLLTIYVAAAYRTIDFILNDETSLATFIGSLATDVVKVGIVSGVSWAASSALSFLPFIVGPLVIVVATSVLVTVILNSLDDKYGITEKIIDYIESAQQEFVSKAREFESEVWDLGGMYVEGKLKKGAKVIEGEVIKYLKNSINDITPRIF